MRALLSLIGTLGGAIFLLGVLWLLHATRTRFLGLPMVLVGALLLFVSARGFRRLE